MDKTYLKKSGCAVISLFQQISASLAEYVPWYTALVDFAITVFSTALQNSAKGKEMKNEMLTDPMQ